MKRGEIWTVAGGTGYSGKPRPAVIVQADDFGQTPSVTICLITSTGEDAPDIRIAIAAIPESGLRQNSFVMIDKINTIKRDKVGRRIGQVAPEELAQINTALMLFFGLAE